MKPRWFVCAFCRDGKKVRHHIERVTDAREGIYGGLWGFSHCPNDHEIGWDITEEEYQEVKEA